MPTPEVESSSPRDKDVTTVDDRLLQNDEWPGAFQPRANFIRRGQAMRAIWRDVVLAESADTIVVEGNHYFPPDALRREYVRPSATHTTCAWKGEASYY